MRVIELFSAVTEEVLVPVSVTLKTEVFPLSFIIPSRLDLVLSR